MFPFVFKSFFSRALVFLEFEFGNLDMCFFWINGCSLLLGAIGCVRSPPLPQLEDVSSTLRPTVFLCRKQRNGAFFLCSDHLSSLYTIKTILRFFSPLKGMQKRFYFLLSIWHFGFVYSAFEVQNKVLSYFITFLICSMIPSAPTSTERNEKSLYVKKELISWRLSLPPSRSLWGECSSVLAFSFIHSFFGLFLLIVFL